MNCSVERLMTKSRTVELKIFLKNERIDINLISETNFTLIQMNGNHITHTFYLSNKARGETAVIIKDNIKHYERI